MMKIMMMMVLIGEIVGHKDKTYSLHEAGYCPFRLIPLVVDRKRKAADSKNAKIKVKKKTINRFSFRCFLNALKTIIIAMLK